MKSSLRIWSRLLGALLLLLELGCAGTTGKPNVPAVEDESSDNLLAIKKALANAREARCNTAICFGGTDQTKYAVEPLAELPIGKTFTLMDHSSLGTFINNHEFSADLAAGIRVWFAYDIASISLYLSKPLSGTEDRIRINGSRYEQPASRVKRPYPGIALGLFNDTLWIGFDVNELHNGSSDDDRDLRFPRDAVISRSLTWTIALTPITTSRNVLGVAKGTGTPNAKRAKSRSTAARGPVKAISVAPAAGPASTTPVQRQPPPSSTTTPASPEIPEPPPPN